MIRTVYADSAPEVCKRLDRLAKKAERYGVPFSYTVGEERPQQVAVYAVDFVNHEQFVDHVFTVAAVDIDIDCDGLVKANGWTVLAHIEHGESGNIVTSVGGAEIDNAWYSAPARCDHCGTNRTRTVTFIVENESGERRQVGKSCLKDYTGIAPGVALMWAEVVDLFPDLNCSDREWSERKPAMMYETRIILAHAYESINAKGYIKSEYPNSTRDTVTELVKADVVPSEDALKAADEMVEWLAGIDNNVIGIERDCAPLARSGYAKVKHIGRLAYMPVAYKQYLRRKAETEAKEAARASAAMTSKHVGNIGDRIDFVAVKAEFITSWETMYGHTFLYKFTDESGNVYVWFASGAFDERNGMKVRGTVKKHDERDGVKQTVLTRCKVC